MIISVQIKLFLNIFNYKVFFNVFIIFYLKNKFGWKIFFNYKTIGFIIIWLNIKLIKQRRLRWVLSETKISIWWLILFPRLPSQSSFVQGHFKCSFKSMQSSFENHNSCRCYWIWHSETNIESIHVHVSSLKQTLWFSDRTFYF